jgi:hypothetical protein
MPMVVAEHGSVVAPRDGGDALTRSRGRILLLALLIVLLTLVVPAVVVPMVRPLKLRLSGEMIIVGTTTITTMWTGLFKPGFSYLVRDEGPKESDVVDAEGVHYAVTGKSRVMLFRVGDWVYYVVWFHGHPR